MPVEFEMEINVQTSTRGGYRAFIENLRVQLGVRYSHNRPALVVQEEPPTRFFDLVIRTNDHSVRFRLRMDNLYLIGYQMENGQWLEFNNNTREHLILEQRTTFLGFNGSYIELVNVAGLNMEQIRVGFYNLGYGINQLATSTVGKIRAHYLIVVIMMICESTRLVPMSQHMATRFDNSHGTSSYDYDNSDNRNRERQIEPWITDLVRAWGSFSGALLRADADPGQSFRLRSNVVRIPPDYGEITTIAQAADIIGILLGLCFRGSGPRRIPRMTFDEGQCFLGLPLVEVFSVRIDNIDGEDPGQLYGTITVNDGLNIEYIYNRTSSNPESIKPGQNASLTGPSQSILAIGNFTIKLLLTDKDEWSWDDEIINKDISWDASEIGNVYDKCIFQKLDGNRGSVTVNYAVLRDAVAAKITVTLVEGGESPANVYGQVYAHYDNWENPSTTCLLFNRSSGYCVDVRRWRTIPLLRSVVAVPLNRSLIVKASLYDHDTLSGDDEIAGGAVQFPAKLSGTSLKQIQGEDGNSVEVTVNWSSEI
ncbi:jasmonate-induced-like protein isoform X1 [Cinnamomum micranthum f. kanehirae]|uniref:rRNA N-glycosylase n=1 Tax=Cinnamomum micranthum f. kanehirae TaxID=337451 RepID=A0A3S3LW82_9MAGN|nr:jasmonate-induced-like protein isoform X1 [Cinnamomum micranthum f. kanehirae]